MRGSRIAAVVFATALAVTGASPAVSASVATSQPTARFIVTLRPGTDPLAVATDHRATRGPSVTHVYRHALRGYAASLTPAAASSLAADPRVVAVVPDRPVRMTAQTVPAGIERIGADESSAVAGNGKGAVDADIAVLDTGIDAKHRDLNVVGGVNCVQGNNSSLDLNGHGTHVAGTAAARDNSVGVVGVAPGARLWAVRVLDAGGGGLWSTIICGIDWVTAHADTIEVANMSLGGPGSGGSCTDGGLREAICRSTAAGVTYVVSAGNAASDASGFVPGGVRHVDLARRRLPVDLGHLDGQPPRRRGGGAVPVHPPRRLTHRGPRCPRRRRSTDWVGDPDSTQEPLLDVSTF